VSLLKRIRRKTPPDDKTMTANPYTNSVDTVIEMFADGTVGESTEHNRLITVEHESGDVALVGYGEKILARYDEQEGRVEVYTGHEDGAGPTVAKWLDKITTIAGSRRDVDIKTGSPWFRPPNDEAAHYINNYFDFRGNISNVEQEALENVIDSLKFLDKFL
jgi:hypothetical protein